MFNKSAKGFTLIELSIVLVIIGLIVGSIVGGQSLIKSAKQGAIVSEINSIKVAIKAFELQYDAMPGDMTDAFDYFGAVCGTDTPASSGGCNGNGDTFVNGQAEHKRAWQHLSLSEVYNSGVALQASLSSGYSESNLVHAAIDGGYYRIASSTSGLYRRGFGNYIFLATISDSGNVHAGAALDVLDARAIDRKMDDGEADRGLVFSGTGGYGVNEGQCTTGVFSNHPPSPYILSNKGINCEMAFLLD